MNMDPLGNFSHFKRTVYLFAGLLSIKRVGGAYCSLLGKELDPQEAAPRLGVGSASGESEMCTSWFKFMGGRLEVTQRLMEMLEFRDTKPQFTASS